MKYSVSLLLLAGSVCGAVMAAPGLPDFHSTTLPEFTQLHDVRVDFDAYGGAPAWRIEFGTEAPWPNLAFAAPDGGWDWSSFAGIRLDVVNPGTDTLDVHIRVDNAGANGTDHCNTKQQSVPAGAAAQLDLFFNTGDRARFWGMRGLPIRGPMGTGATLDLARISGWQVFLNQPDNPQTLILTSVTLIGQGGDVATQVAFPFIDAFGQYRYQEWPEKIHAEADLADAYDRERAARPVANTEALDTFGGWAAGPQLEATGRFRTEQVDGQWWLVTPEGHLFFSAGVDCVGTWSHTFIEKREDWFAWLPDPADDRFKEAFGYARGAHSMAETIGGEGRTFGFYAANLIRAFGPDWKMRWRENTLDRLRAWGFNTLGNWSQWDVLQEGNLPFVANLGISGVRPIEAATGYWARMMDVYDPGFVVAVDEAVRRGTEPWRDNPRCIGYFVDNELAWEGIVDGALRSAPEQPVHQALRKFLSAR
jgi:hypothetical protein